MAITLRSGPLGDGQLAEGLPYASSAALSDICVSLMAYMPIFAFIVHGP